MSLLGKRVRVRATGFEGKVIALEGLGLVRVADAGAVTVIAAESGLVDLEAAAARRPDPLHILFMILAGEVDRTCLDYLVKKAIEMTDYEALGAAAAQPSTFTQNRHFARAIDLERERRGIEPFRARDLKHHAGGA